jgi:hypothetical protein
MADGQAIAPISQEAIMRFIIFISLGVLSGFAQALTADTIPAGTQVEVRSDATIDVRDADGRIYPGHVMHDVLAADGDLIIPRGAEAELIVRRFGYRDFAIDLESVTVNGRRFAVDTTAAESIHRKGDGARTGEFAGGGAVIGSILGAIAGGGKGAAIGALAGGAAGAGAAIATRGEHIFIPAESTLSFRLERPLNIYRDPGYERGGIHYHNDYQGDRPQGDPFNQPPDPRYDQPRPDPRYDQPRPDPRYDQPLPNPRP